MIKTIAAAALAALTFAAPAAAEPAAGLWKSQPGETGGYIHVRIAPCGGAVCGTIEEVIGNDNQSIVGRQIIWDMQPQGDGQYRGGRIWAPDQDRTYRSNMAVGTNTMVVEGCVAVFCREQTWTRLQ
jgi:uncharacterized protein (DUF2147 family)